MQRSLRGPRTCGPTQSRARHLRAEPLRHGLLYEAGAPLVAAVRTATESADLLVSLTAEGAPRHLVEIKGVGGTAPENLVRDLQRHLDTWPQLRPQQPVAGGVLIVNHQHKLDPSERSRQAYGTGSSSTPSRSPS